MRTIHKVALDPSAGVYAKALPGCLRWLDAGTQDGQLVAWAEVDTDDSWRDAPLVAVEWTGQPSVRAGIYTPGTWRFLRSVQVGRLVCHVFAFEESPYA